VIGTPPRDRRNAWFWLVANGLAGPVMGVEFYQWALATTPRGIVMPIAARTPPLPIPIAWWLEPDRPSSRSLIGAGVAITGCIALTLAR
jgi:drug/metabolite transporter (DMT)-like permease